MVRRRNFDDPSVFTSSDDDDDDDEEEPGVRFPVGRSRASGRGKSVETPSRSVCIPLGPSRRAARGAKAREVEPTHRITDRRGDDGRGDVLVELDLSGSLASLERDAWAEISHQKYSFRAGLGAPVVCTQSTFHLGVPGRFRANVQLPAKVCKGARFVRASEGKERGRMVFVLPCC